MCRSLSAPLWTSSSFPFSPWAPDLVDGRDGDQASSEHLHFGPTDNQELVPVLAVWPILLLVPPGVAIPPGHAIVEPLEIPSTHDMAIEWCKAMQVRLLQNEGFSLDKGGPVFDLTKFEPNAHLEHSSVVTRVTPVLHLLLPGAPSHQTFHAQFTALSQACWVERGAAIAPADVSDDEVEVVNAPLHSTPLCRDLPHDFDDVLEQILHCDDSDVGVHCMGHASALDSHRGSVWWKKFSQVPELAVALFAASQHIFSLFAAIGN